MRSWTEGAGRHEIVVFVYRGVSSAVVEVLAGAVAAELEGHVVLTSPESGPVVGIDPARLMETVPLDEAPEPSVLVVPGGLAWRREAERAATTAWLRAAVGSARGVLAVSTGTLLLAAAGLVEGDEAAGHWLAGDLMEELGVRKSTDRVVHNRLLVTASGALAGADAARVLAGAVRFSPWARSDRGVDRGVDATPSDR
ncbi:MAG: DJ-1/PfpI family protein [Actinomycetota bacterium]